MNLKVIFHTVHRRIVDNLAKSGVLGRQVDGIRVKNHVEHHASHVFLVQVIARWYQCIWNGPLKTAMTLFARGLTGRSSNDRVLANVQKTLPVTVHTSLYDVTGLGIDKCHINAPFLLELRNLLLVDFPVIRVRHLLRVFDQQLAEFLLLQTFSDILQFLARHFQILPIFLARLVYIHLTRRSCVYKYRPVVGR